MNRVSINRWLLILLATAIPFSIAAVNVILSLISMTMAFNLAIDRRWKWSFLTDPLFLAIAAFTIWDVAATIISGYPANLKAQFEDKWVLMCLIAPLTIGNRKDLTTVAAVFIISGSIAAAYGWIQFFTGWDYLRSETLEPYGNGFLAVGTFNHHLTYGGVILIVTAMAISFTIFTDEHSGRIKNALLSIIALISLAFSFARSAIIGAGAATVAGTFMLKPRVRRWALMAAPILLFSLIFAVPGMGGRFMRIFGNGEHTESTRVLLWRTSLNIIADHPLIGVGQGNFSRLFDRYKAPGVYNSTAHPHNDYLSAAVDAGLIGLVLYIIMIIVIIRRLTQYCRKIPIVPSVCAIPRGALLAFIGILTAGLFQNYLTDAEVANALWFVIGLGFQTGRVAVNIESTTDKSGEPN